MTSHDHDTQQLDLEDDAELEDTDLEDTDLDDADVEDTDVEELDDDLAFAPTARGGIGRSTALLLVGIALVGAFGAGVWAQKQQGTAAGSLAGPPAGLRMGNFGGAAPGGDAAAAGAAGAGGTSGTTTTGTAATAPAVIGTVVKVSGSTVTVKNFAGKTVKVTVPDGVRITKSQTVTADDLAAGTAVTVTGTTASDGSVTATGVTAR